MVDGAGAPQPITITKKVVLLGATAVGKTSIFTRIQQNEYIEDNVTTMAAYFGNKSIEYPEFNCKLKINLWDTAGQERFQSLTRQYIQSAAGVVLVYDVTDAQSLQEAKDWYDRMKQQIDPNTLVLALVGNKCDDLERVEVSKRDSEQLAETISAQIQAIVSAKTGQNIEKLFNDFGQELIKRDNSIRRSSSMILSPKAKQKKGGCCGGKDKKQSK